MSELEKDFEEFRDLTIALFQKSKGHKAAIISQHCASLGAMIALISPDESNLLDSISIAHRQIREHAADCFVKAQKAIKELKAQE